MEKNLCLNFFLKLFQSKELQEKYDTTVQKLEECRDLLKTNENGRSKRQTVILSCLMNKYKDLQ